MLARVLCVYILFSIYMFRIHKNNRSDGVCVSVRACVRVCARACVRVRSRVRVCARARACVRARHVRALSLIHI